MTVFLLIFVFATLGEIFKKIGSLSIVGVRKNRKLRSSPFMMRTRKNMKKKPKTKIPTTMRNNPHKPEQSGLVHIDFSRSAWYNKVRNFHLIERNGIND